jgi:hypothetical protein
MKFDILDRPSVIALPLFFLMQSSDCGAMIKLRNDRARGGT